MAGRRPSIHASKGISVRVPEPTFNKVVELGGYNYSQWVRDAIEEKIQRSVRTEAPRRSSSESTDRLLAEIREKFSKK